MSTRLKVFLIITAIVLAITMSSMVISISSAQGQIIKTLEADMKLVVTLANEYILGEMDRLKTDAAAIAYTLSVRNSQSYELQELLLEQVAGYENFGSAFIFNADGNIIISTVNNINSVPPVEFIRMASRGEKIISSSVKDTSGRTVFYVFVPYDDYAEIRGESYYQRSILGLTVDGNFFSEKLNHFTRLASGHITMVDKKGTIIADMHEEWVNEQINFPELAAAGNAKYEDIARVIALMLLANDATGTDRFELKGEGEADMDNVIAFRSISSAEHWAIGVSTSIAESPFSKVRGMIAVSGFIFLLLGSLAAALASGVIAKPFEIAKAASKAKTAFIANMSHDLRTPLNAIIGLSELSLTKNELSPDIINYQDKIFRSGNTILGVVNDLLDISNIESGKFGVISAEYDLPNFINDTANANLAHIGSKPVMLSIIPDEKLPVKLISDALRVRQIFNNLLSNAFDYTREGTVEWNISAEREGDTVWLVSTIMDSGIGIKPEEIDKMFLDYSSLDTQKNRSSKGTGMGLALTKKIVDLMKGTITVESAYGKGSTFTVRLPQKFVNDEVISAVTLENLKKIRSAEQKHHIIASFKRVQLSNARVLVVDDLEINLEVVRGMIEPYGIKVDCVLSGAEAVAHIRRGEPKYNAIFMNRWMPEMDGIEAVRLIRNEIGTEYARKVPIIALTANAVTGNNAFFLKAGFQDVLPKPIGIMKLDEVIRHWVAAGNV